MTDKNKAYTALLGALVADAASLRLHWIYDVDLIDQIIEQNAGQTTFVPNGYEGIPEYHSARTTGMQTQYGETLLLALQSMQKTSGLFDIATYQADFTAHFGPDGPYNGYIDRPTKGTLENIANGQVLPSGIDDDQLPALSRIPAIVATGQSGIEDAIEITNVNTIATANGHAFADLLNKVIKGDDLSDALYASANSAHHSIRQPLLDALASPETNSVEYGATTGRACHLPMAAPLMFHILKNTQSYVDAIETNIKSGGDNAGRSVMLGAICSTAYGVVSIPEKWISATNAASSLKDICAEICTESL